MVAIKIGEPVETGCREIDDAALAHRHVEGTYAGRHGDCRKSQRIGCHHLHLVLVHLQKIEAPAPCDRIRQGQQRTYSVGLYRQKQGMQIAIDRSAEVGANELSGFQIELEAADQIDVESVQSCEQRLEAKPAPTRNSPGEPLAPAFFALVVQRDPVAVMRHFYRRPV